MCTPSLPRTGRLLPNRGASASSPEVLALEEACFTAWHRWARLARTPGCWEEPQKRREMLQARLEYQDAAAELHRAVRQRHRLRDAPLGAGDSCRN
jgi:hypothetical protein